MKAAVLAVLLFTTPIVIDTTKVADGAVDVRREGSRTVSVARVGDTVTVRIDEGKRVDTVTITRDAEGHVSIGHKDNGELRDIIALDRRPVVVDGIDLEPFLAGNFFGSQHNPQMQMKEIPAPESRAQGTGPRYYICPKDETMVRVKPGKAPAEMKCPVDGTPMKAGTGRDSQIFLLH